ncbi:MAG: site-2 protease family protein [Collinsella sp.]
MDTVLSVLSSVFWGLLMLSVLVFLHEGGHFLAARACGVRVTEFFLGLPCRFDIHHTSRRIGTKFGVTPLLLGGYAAIWAWIRPTSRVPIACLLPSIATAV